MADMQRAAEQGTLNHRIVRMGGRDPNEKHRVSTPLELLFDLTFAVAFGQAGDQASHLIAEGHLGSAVGGFIFSMFAICWAWINFSWFASAYDTDDWFMRITTMVQMVGVLILALGLPALFTSLDQGHGLDNRVMVAGYVVMRIAMVAQWLRAAHQDPTRRRTAMAFAGCLLIAQVGWVILAVADTPIHVVLAVAPVLYAIELIGPMVAERKTGGTPWHAHHISERYGLLAIIALGEGLIGTIASVSAIIQDQGWSSEAIAVVIAGVGLTFALWWNYFLMPSGEILHVHRDRAWGWGYGHMFIFASIAATGAGIHVAAYLVEGTSKIGTFGTVLAVAIPVAIYLLALFGTYTNLVREGDMFHIWLSLVALVPLVAGAVIAHQGGSLGLSLALVTLAPCLVVAGYETIGHRHAAEVLERATAG